MASSMEGKACVDRSESGGEISLVKEAMLGFAMKNEEGWEL